MYKWFVFEIFFFFFRPNPALQMSRALQKVRQASSQKTESGNPRARAVRSTFAHPASSANLHLVLNVYRILASVALYWESRWDLAVTRPFRRSVRMRFSAELIDMRFVAVGFSQRLPVHRDRRREVCTVVLDVCRGKKSRSEGPRGVCASHVN